MLEKTMQKLAGIAPGTHLPDDADCYDPEEIEQLGRVLSLLVYAPSVIRKRLQAMGATLTRADQYAEIPTIVELEDSFHRGSLLRLDQMFCPPDALRRFLIELSIHATEFNPPKDSSDPHRFAWQNDLFSYSDAMAYYAMIRRYRPRTVLELGCGASSLVALEALRANGSGRLICVDPLPGDMLRSLPGATLIERRAQQLEDDFLSRYLTDGDIVFIDTTHTVRHDSDCLHIYLRLLPALRSQAYVHVHDIHLPGTLPLEMMRDHQLFWNEQYLLCAYMQDNPRVSTLYGSAWHMRHNPDGLAQFMRGQYTPGGASFWFSQAGRPDAAPQGWPTRF